MADPHDKPTQVADRVSEDHHQPADASDHFRQELQHDFETGNGRKLLEEMRAHHMKVDDMKEIDNKFGVLTIEDDHGHKMDLTDGMHKDKDGHFVLDNGSKIGKDGKVIFNDGVSIGANGLVTEDGKVQTDLSNPIAASDASNDPSVSADTTETTVNNTNAVVSSEVAAADTGNISPDNITSTMSHIQEMIQQYTTKGRTAPAGFTSALDNLNSAQGNLASKDARNNNGPNENNTEVLAA